MPSCAQAARPTCLPLGQFPVLLLPLFHSSRRLWSQGPHETLVRGWESVADLPEPLALAWDSPGTEVGRGFFLLKVLEAKDSEMYGVPWAGGVFPLWGLHLDWNLTLTEEILILSQGGDALVRAYLQSAVKLIGCFEASYSPVQPNLPYWWCRENGGRECSLEEGQHLK